MEQKPAPNKRKIFISWSGKSSHLAAIALKESLPTIIQVLDPFLSSADIEKGVRWFAEIGSQLEQTNFGILCITRDNIEAPWILFEAGALSKSLDHSRVVPLLIGVSNSDLQGPLSQFNTTSIDKDDVKKLLRTINVHLGDYGITESQLDKAFELCWPDLQERFTDILTRPAEDTKTPASRPTKDVLDEILQLTRKIAQRPVASTSPSRSVQKFQRAEMDPTVDMELVRRMRDVILQMFKEGKDVVNSDEVFMRLLDSGLAIPAYHMLNALNYLRETGAISGPGYMNSEATKQHGAMTITDFDSDLLPRIGG